MSRKNKTAISLLCAISCVALVFWLFFGVFVIQPIGAIPDGVTIIYWRSGLDMPFIASADGLLEKSETGVSLMGRALMLAKLSEPIREREVFRLPYFQTLYLWSTDGRMYEK